MIQNMMAIVSRSVHRQGRFLRRQVFDLALTLMIIGAGIILLLAAMIAGGMTAYAVLRPVAGPAGALAIITLFLSLAALVMGLTGYLIQAESDRRYGLNKAADNRDDPNKPHQGRTRNMTREEAAREREAYEAWLRAHPNEGGAAGRTDTAGSTCAGSTGGAFGLTAEQLAMARDTLGMTQTELDHKLDLVRRHPMASVGVAAGLGLVLGQSRTARKLAKGAAVLGGKYLMDHFLYQQPIDPRPAEARPPYPRR